MDGDSDVCWICLEGSDAGELRQVCNCPRKVHSNCLARWQLQQAGKDEEKYCRFCSHKLADWKPHMMTGHKVTTPYMRVSFNGRTHKVAVKPGPDGMKEFENQIRAMLQLPQEQDFDVIFHCRAPGTGDKLQLQGLCAFDAAVHCASMTSWPTTQAQSSEGNKQQRHRRMGFVRQVIQQVVSRLDLALGTTPSSA